MTSDAIRERIVKALPDAQVTLEDLTGGGDHWSAVVVSEAFAGKSRVQQHQMVYRALGDAMSGPIHALALKTSTPDLQE
ncbi:MAG: BolA family protein [Myxococcota bacterium]